MKFKGTFEELETLFAEAGFDGRWSKKSDTQHQFEFNSGGYFNWYDSKKGTVLIQGNADEKEHINSLILPVLDGLAVTTSRTVTKLRSKNNRVFVVYGHDRPRSSPRLSRRNNFPCPPKRRFGIRNDVKVSRKT